ncbi:isocitrate dehydrogenase [Salpingoeca rosetta]|uniref:Isocitrate dehydrogenase n=1 Tax=Salpingoeca rosetta (strain ATCC 50818 / BSB-021) TaxID=946362 RepID=F2U8H7_SALR5|nr:isocitrate dehydrogenase [Salpingoeca rosetta]EGD72685.1 isocitrate dehydrogenase [Salpingoeca rosetta]|eukprot:XP_004994508.1 isocitrate dehydrogenase [Salpingoeca rosetta]
MPNDKRSGVYISDEHVDVFDDIGVLFKGPLTIPPTEAKTYVEVKGNKYTSGNQVFRKYFQLFANVRPAKTMPGVPAPFSNVDLVVIRENTEDVYTGEERWVDDNTVICNKRITRHASERIARYAIEFAQRMGRRRVTALHKANVCKQSDGLFLSSFKKIANELTATSSTTSSTKSPTTSSNTSATTSPTTASTTSAAQLRCDDHLADSCLTRLVLAPREFDVLCCPNLYGDLVSDLAGGMIGSLGLCPSGNIGERHALFEPAHGSAPDIAGKGIANPASQILSAVLMLQHLGEMDAATRLHAALSDTFSAGTLPVDLGGNATTRDIVDSVVSRLTA